MSIVGTRPPLISETNLYEPHHKASKAFTTYKCHAWNSIKTEQFIIPEIIRHAYHAAYNRRTA